MVTNLPATIVPKTRWLKCKMRLTQHCESQTGISWVFRGLRDHGHALLEHSAVAAENAAAAVVAALAETAAAALVETVAAVVVVVAAETVAAGLGQAADEGARQGVPERKRPQPPAKTLPMCAPTC